MEDFYTKEVYTEADILELINNKIEESISMEFKRAEAISNNREIAKDVSAFANSNGGIIIYGIEEVDHKANSLSFIDGNKYSKERIEQILNSQIIRRIPNLEIAPIRFEGKIEKTVYIVKIPESNLAPHMVNNRYYKRYNFTTQYMEEYEVRHSYLRVNSALLEISYPKVISIKAESKDQAIFNLVFEIKNIGHAMENNYKLEIILPKVAFAKFGYIKGTFDEEKAIENPITEYKTHEYKNKYRYLIFGREPIFKDEVLKLAECFVRVTDEILEEKILMKLYSSNSIVTKEFSFKEIMLYFQMTEAVSDALIKNDTQQK